MVIVRLARPSVELSFTRLAVTKGWCGKNKGDRRGRLPDGVALLPLTLRPRAVHMQTEK